MNGAVEKSLKREGTCTVRVRERSDFLDGVWLSSELEGWPLLPSLSAAEVGRTRLRPSPPGRRGTTVGDWSLFSSQPSAKLAPIAGPMRRERLAWSRLSTVAVYEKFSSSVL